MNSYFRYFNEVNKLSDYIKDENNFINYETVQAHRDLRSHDLLLDYIYKNRDLDLAEIIFPLVEDKSSLKRFVKFLKSRDKCHSNEHRWIDLIFNNIIKDTQIDISKYKDKLFFSGCFYGFLEIVKYTINIGADIHFRNNSGIIWACKKDHIEIFKFFIDLTKEINVKSLLRISCKHQSLNVINFLIQESSNKNKTIKNIFKYENRYESMNVINSFVTKEYFEVAAKYAIIYDNLDVIKYLVEKGYSFDNNWMMKKAIKENSWKIVEFLNYYSDSES